MTSSNHAVCIESTEQLLLRHVELNASNSQSSPIPRINASTQICVQEDQLDDAESNSSSSINDQLSILAEDEYDDDIVFTPHPPTTSNGVLTSAPTYMMEESKMIHPNDNNINNTKNLAEPFSSQLQQSPPKVDAPQPHEDPSTTLHLHHGRTTPSSSSSSPTSSLFHRLNEILSKFPLLPVCCSVKNKNPKLKSQLIPCMSISSILLTISALIIIWIMVTLPYQDVTTKPYVNLMTSRAAILARYVGMRGFARLHVTNNFTTLYSPASTYSSYYYYKGLMNSSMVNLTMILPNDFQHEFLNDPNQNNSTTTTTTTSTTNRDSNAPFNYPLVKLWDQVLVGPTIFQTFTFNATTNQTRVRTFLNTTAMNIAKRTYASPEYAQHVQSYESLFESFIGNLTQYCTRIEDTARSSYIVTLSVLGFCFLVVIPVMILVLMFIMKRDSQNEKLLNHTSQHLLKETLLDPALRSAFKLYCKERGLESTMNILEKVMQYKEHCKISHSIQMKVFELTHDYVKQHKEEKQKKSEMSIGMNMIHTTSSSGNRTINKSLNSSQMQFASGEDRKALFIFKISNEADKKIIHQECLKSQLVFEIIDQSQDHSILSKVGTLESQHIDPQQIQHSGISTRILEEICQVYDQYNNRQDLFEEIDILPPHLLDSLERELSDALSLTHLNFKSSYLCQSPQLSKLQHLDDATSTDMQEEFMSHNSSEADSKQPPITQV